MVMLIDAPHGGNLLQEIRLDKVLLEAPVRAGSGNRC